MHCERPPTCIPTHLHLARRQRGSLVQARQVARLLSQLLKAVLHHRLHHLQCNETIEGGRKRGSLVDSGRWNTWAGWCACALRTCSMLKRAQIVAQGDLSDKQGRASVPTGQQAPAGHITGVVVCVCQKLTSIALEEMARLG